MRRRWLFSGALFCSVAGGVLLYSQGMAVGTRAPRPAPKIDTDLPPAEVDFRDVGRAAGLTAITISGDKDRKKYILESTGPGLAIFDYDNDGLPDIFLVNATRFDLDPKAAAPTNHLYRNTGNLKFQDVTDKAGLIRSGWGQGVCAGDYDNDGNRDLFLTYYGQNVLYRNDGKGGFRDVTSSAGLKHPSTRWSTGCSFFDYDIDGRLDLFVSGYVEFDRTKVPEPGGNVYCQWKGLPVMCGPRGLPAGRNYLYHNEGGGRFRDVSESSGVATPTGCYGFSAVASDFDNDGLPDVYVACDSTPSLLYRNTGKGVFEEVGVPSGAALNEDGQEQAGMGVAVADYDEDGFPDIVKTNFSDDVPNLYHNNGDGTFTDKVFIGGVGVHTKYLGWGVNFIDVDHDGRRDILIVNGHVYPEIDRSSLGATFRQPRLLFWNVGGRFKDISAGSGEGISAQASSRGSATGDLDNDGSLEVVIINLESSPSLLKNFGKKGNWLLVQCTGTTANRDAVGARIFVHTGKRTLSSEVQTGTSYLSQSDSRQHFGLGDADRYDRIEVLWPGGSREVFEGGPANRIVALKQGSGKPVLPSAAGSAR